jgi:hypothetical protein
MGHGGRFLIGGASENKETVGPESGLSVKVPM